MNPTKINTLLELIEELVTAPGMTWGEKREAVFAEADEDDRTNLEEFCSWFEGEFK